MPQNATATSVIVQIRDSKMFLQKQYVLSVIQMLDRYYTHTHTHQSVSQHFLEMEVPSNAKDEMLDTNMRNKLEHKHII